ncbi:MAG: hypothetical protein N0E48_09995, partial [Candidatus Thiodiazotropha endolucinida]|nr:hypothetical protein [Candidatus Thiodiazotropha taylori]MCW4343680.1 hypothetical protein [Candidatus Thiodiazotropha endolucinida]
MTTTTGNASLFPWDPGGSQNNIMEDRYPTVIALVAEQEVLISEESPEGSVCPVATTTSYTCWGFNPEELRTEQAKDSDLDIVLTFLEKGEFPSEGKLFLASPAAKQYWINKERCALIDGLLYCDNKEGTHQCLVLPAGMKEEAMRLNHDLPSAGHQGVARTKSRMKEKFLWYQMSRDIEQYVLSCATCNQNKKSGRYGRHPLMEYHACAPMERIH